MPEGVIRSELVEIAIGAAQAEEVGDRETREDVIQEEFKWDVCEMRHGRAMLLLEELFSLRPLYQAGSQVGKDCGLGLT